MPRLIPRITQPTHAIKLKRDLIAEKGSWLLIFEDESLMTMSDQEVKAAFKFENTTGPKPGFEGTTIKTRTRTIGCKPKTLTCEIEGKTIRIGAQGIRVLQAMLDHETHTKHFTVSAPKLVEYLSSPADQQQISARVTEANSLGLVHRESDIRPYYWSLTNNGRELVRLLGEQAQQYI